MESLWVAKTGLEAQQMRMTVVSQNLANVNTTGYKRQRTMFEDLLYQNVVQTGGLTSQQTSTPTGLNLGTGVHVVATDRQFQQGNIVTTGNPLDLAIHGEGWFVVDRPEGTAYTRNGHFTLNEKGQLTTTGGYPVLATDGTPITLGVEDQAVEISADGTVSTPGGRKARLDIVKFPQGTVPEKAGETLFTTTAAPEKAVQAKVIQGMIEGSNVRPVVEVTNMIWALRSYQAATEVTVGEDGLLRKAIDVLTDTTV